MNEKKEKSLVNFKKAQSHISKIMKMIEDDEYCVDIMQQNLAVMGLLKSAQQLIMEGHLNSCFKDAMKTKDEDKQQKMIKEILVVSNWVNR
jgi:CsoR family transcriptional regulator, copper-sensing transcriptional repressor